MFAPASVDRLLPSTYSAFWTPALQAVSVFAPMIITVFWFLIFPKTYSLAGVNRRQTRICYYWSLLSFVTLPGWQSSSSADRFSTGVGGPPL
jgi:hypothetical protein